MTEPPRTVPALLAGAASAHPHRTAIRHQGDELSFDELATRVSAAARGLMARGVETGDRVAVWSQNGPDWVVADLATAAIGGVVVPIYPTSSAAEAAFIVRNSGARLVFCDDPDQAAALRQHVPVDEYDTVGIGEGSHASFVELCFAGALQPRGPLHERIAKVTPSDLYRIIYTSGTTGPPKGCPLTHANVTAAVALRAAADPVNPDDRFFLFLPLAHAYGSAVQLLALSCGALTIHALGSMDALIDQLADERPSHLLAVPRFVEKLQARLSQGRSEAFLSDAVALAEDVNARRAAGQPVDPDSAWRLEELDRDLFADVRSATGGALRRAVVGAAPVATDTLRFFRAAGVLVLQGYGMTESSGFAALCTPDHYRFGAVGRPLPGLDVRIAEDGEILLKGPNVFSGYAQGTAADFGGVEDGWLHTGDLGSMGDDGMLEVTGRLKNLIVTAGGKNIAPENLERDLQRSPLIERAVVCGDRRPYPVALIALDEAALAAWASARGLPENMRSLLDGEALRPHVTTIVDAVNEHYSQPERIKDFAVLDAPLTVGAGELTPSMKVRRGTVLDRYASLIDSLYPEGQTCPKP